jgi:hypothetical protein
VIEIDDVLEAKIACFGQILSNYWNIDFLTSNFSVAA